ncbi:MAG: PAS domain S-box protein [Desulfobacteraceae bacterium]|nr:PAS domain S-box protein [Desulfobacteraceae bacterium]
MKDRKKIYGIFLSGHKKLLMIFLTGLGVFGISVLLFMLGTGYVRNQAEKRVRDTMLECRAFHKYVQKNLLPAYYRLMNEGELPNGFYSPELLSSSYISRTFHRYYNEERQKSGLPEIKYKMAAADPRNDANKADEFEEKIISWFNQDKSRKKYSQIIEKNGKSQLIYATPFLEVKKQCLKCHGKPEDAPSQLLNRYEWSGGWNRKVGDVVAAEFIISPLEGEYDFVLIMVLSAIVLLTLCMSLFLFNLRLRKIVDLRTKDLLESRALYRSIAEDTPVMICRFHPGGEILYVNKAYCDYFNKSSDEFVGSNFMEMIPQEERARVLSDIFELSPECPTRSHEHKVTGADGEIYWQRWTNRGIFGNKGRLLVCQSIGEDVTDRKKAEEELRKSEEKFRKIFENAGIGIVLTNPEYKILHCNPLYCSLLGYGEKELENLDLAALIHPDDKEKYRVQAQMLKSGKLSSFEINCNCVHRQGFSVRVRKFVSVLTGEDKKITGMLVLVSDITGQIVDEMKLRLMEFSVDHCAYEIIEKFLEEAKSITGSETAFYRVYEDNTHSFGLNTRLEIENQDENNVCFSGVQDDFFERFSSDNRPCVINNFDEEVINNGFTGEKTLLRNLFILPFTDIDTRIVLCLGNKKGGFDDKSVGILNQLARQMWEIIARKKSEKALEKSESRLKEAEKIAGFGHWELDLLTNRLFWSDQIYEIFEINPDEFEATYENFIEKIHPDERDMVNNSFQESLRKKIPYFIEHRLMMKDGRIKYVEERCATHYDENDNAQFCIGTIFDVTGRKLIEESLKKSESKYKALFEGIKDAVFVHPCLDEGFENFIEVNSAACERYGYTRDEFLNMTTADIIASDELRRKAEVQRKRVASRNISVFENEHKAKNGEVFPVEVSSQLFEIDGKKAIISLVRDITERRLAEENIIKSENKYKMLIENANDAIFVLWENRIKFFNSRTEKLTGYTYEELMDSDFTVLIHPEDREAFAVKNNERTDNNPLISFFRIVNKNGAEIYAQMSSVDLEWEGMAATLNFLRDMTVQKKLEFQLIHAQKMESIGTLAGGIAHDFNNILSSVIGYAELAMDDARPGTNLHENLLEVLGAGMRARDLTKQILSISRNDETIKKPLQINPLVKEAVKMLRSAIPSSIEIHENVCSEPLVVFAEATRFHQVIVNLITNAMHAMNEMEGIIDVRLEPVSFDESSAVTYPDITPGKYAWLSVSDNGCGIESSHLDKIFEPYFTTKIKGEGTGLGLSIVHRIVKEHNGHISVYSETDKGTVFNIYLPLARKKSVNEPVIKTEEPLPRGKEHILLVDDEPTIVKMQKHQLENLGYEVTAETSSRIALETFRSNPDKFSAVITDMTMPNMTGDKFASALKEIRKDIPVILCTGFSEKINGNTETLNIDSFLMKPVQKIKMAKTLRQVIDKNKKES